MYSELFEKMGLKKENLWPYEGSDMQVLNGTTTNPRGYIKLMITLRKWRDVRKINSQLLVFPGKSVYIYILADPSW